MTHPAMVTVYKRVQRGESWEEALRPGWQPLWMWRIEQEEGRPLRDLLAESAVMAHVTGYGLRHHAQEWGIKRTTLQHWCRQWGITWPRNASLEQHEAATRVANKVRRRAPDEVRTERQDALRRLVDKCGSANQAARMLGIGVNRVSEWRRGVRPVPDRHWPEVQRLAQLPVAKLAVTPAAPKPSEDHPWRRSGKSV